MASVVETRFCRFEAPAGWMTLPGVGAMEKGSAGVSASAVVMENWLAEPTRADAYAKRQAEMLGELAPGTTVVRQESFTRRDLADACVLTVRSATKDGTPLRQQILLAIEGPLAVSLTLTSAEGREPVPARAFPGIVDSFAVAASPWARTIAQGGIVGRAGSSPPASGSVKVPLLQVALPIPPGWTFDEKALALRAPSGAEIVARRGGLPSTAPDELFAEALRQYHGDPAWQPRRWDRGELPDGRAFFAVEAVALQSGTWVKKEPEVIREVFVQDEGLIAFRSRSADGDAAASGALASVVSGYAMLPPAERALAVREAWWRVDLPGPWIAAGGGVYALPPAPARIVAAQKLPASLPLRKFADVAAGKLRNQPDYVSTLADQTRETPVRGLPTIQFAFDYQSREAGPWALRACWAESGGTLYALFVQGPAGPETEKLFTLAAAGLDVEAIRRGVPS